MMTNQFSLHAFHRQLSKVETLPDDAVESHHRTLEVYQVLLDRDTLDGEFLDTISLEDLSWVFDLYNFWPSYEQDIEPEDMNHQGVQKYLTQDLIANFKKQPSVKKKVTFI